MFHAFRLVNGPMHAKERIVEVRHFVDGTQSSYGCSRIRLHCGSLSGSFQEGCDYLDLVSSKIVKSNACTQLAV